MIQDTLSIIDIETVNRGIELIPVTIHISNGKCSFTAMTIPRF
ncbi:MAG: hypothetical protein OEZ34_12965 [Spirochaetia bacterium]|nr:hypothetical protein [Spirochaetia bacterium]